jgi:hypothetical protein
MGKIPRGPLDWGPLRQSGASQHHDLFFFYVSNFVFAAIFFFFVGPLKQIPPKFGEPVRPWLYTLTIFLIIQIIRIGAVGMQKADNGIINSNQHHQFFRFYQHQSPIEVLERKKNKSFIWSIRAFANND